MRRIITFFSLWLTAFAPVALAQEDDRGVLQRFIEDSLSDAGRTVRITGFEGALSSRATLTSLEVEDSEGVWLEVRGAVLEWNRAQILRGALDVSAFSAEEVILHRPPVSAGETPVPEATPFALPDLPVSIRVGRLDIARLSLGEAFVGEAAEVRIFGAVNLAGGEGEANVSLTRIDGKAGQIALAGRYANETRVLALDLEVSEGADGIVARLIDLPGRPPLRLTIAGEDPLSDYTAAIALSTEGQERLAGEVTVAQEVIASETGAAQTALSFAADLGGDLRPLVEEAYRDFLGADLRLSVAGQKAPDGAIDVTDLSLTSEAMDVAGVFALSPTGWPERIDLKGRITSAGPDGIVLPLSGPQTRLDGAQLTLAYDAAQGDTWALDAQVAGVERDSIRIAQGAVTGSGRLSEGVKIVDGRLDLDLSGIAQSDPALQRAVGDQITGGLNFAWSQGAPLQITQVDVTGADYGLTGAAAIDGVDGQIELEIALGGRLVADDLSRFAALAGQSLRGAAALDISGSLSPVSGAFDLELGGETVGLGLGIAPVDPLVAGETRLILSAQRDETGLSLRQLDLASEAARITASGRVATGASDLEFAARVETLGDIIAGASGPATVGGTATQAGERWTVSTDLTAPGQVAGDVTATLDLVEGAAGPLTARATLSAGDLRAYRALVGQPLSGSVALSLDGSGDVSDRSFAVALDGTTQDIGIGQAEADRLLRGRTAFAASVNGQGPERITVERLTLNGQNLTADLSGRLDGAALQSRYSLRLRDLGLFVDGFRGAVTADGSISSAGGPFSLSTDLTGPGGTSARVSGQIARDVQRADLRASGQAPLALANRFSAPNLLDGLLRFDLGLNGPLALSSLSGQVGSTGARLTLPALGLSLNDIAADVRLASGRAVVQVEGNVSSGGRLTVSGPLVLSAPYRSDLTASLSTVMLTDPGLYETLVDGAVALNGPLQGGARITGAITLGQTELRIPDGGGASGSIDGLEHKGESVAVRRTRARAGLLDTGEAGASAGTGRPFPLDLTINAPARIFVRGRGLDAEFGGALQLNGTTRNVIPQGQFDLIRGRLDILGKRLDLTEAFLRLSGGFDPYIRAVAATTADDTLIQIIVEGNASAPDVTFTSTPELPQDEVLARLLFGRDMTQISPLQALQLAQAVRVLAGKGGDGLVGRLREDFGLDDLDVTSDGNGTAGVRVGKYISDNAYTDLSVESNGRSEINLNLDLTPSVTLRGSAASDGDTGLGIFFEREY